MKKLLSVILVLSFLFCLTACGERASSINTPTSNPIGQNKTEPPKTTQTPVTPKHNPTPTPQPPEEDPLEGLLVDENYAKTHFSYSYYGVYLRRNEKLYTLNAHAQNIRYKNYGSLRSFNGAPELRLYGMAKDKFFFFSYGDIPVPKFNAESDEIILFTNQSKPPKIYLEKAEFIGYTIPLYDSLFYYTLFLEENRTIKLEKDQIQEFLIVDSSGNVIDDPTVTPLKLNEIYTVSWFEGIYYQEVEVVAKNKLYSLCSETYEIEPTLTKNGYAKIDVGSLPAGTYSLPYASADNNVGLIEIG